MYSENYTVIDAIARGYHEHVMNSDISRGCRNGENVRFGEIHTILRSHTPHTPHGLQLGSKSIMKILGTEPKRIQPSCLSTESRIHGYEVYRAGRTGGRGCG
jgi:hypothetical protein